MSLVAMLIGIASMTTQSIPTRFFYTSPLVGLCRVLRDKVCASCSSMLYLQDGVAGAGQHRLHRVPTDRTLSMLFPIWVLLLVWKAGESMCIHV